MPDIFSSVTDGGLTAASYFICTAAAIVCGIISAFSASFRNRISKSFFLCLVLLPVIVANVIIMVNGNIGTGVAVMGAFSLVRFRSAAGRAKEIAAIFAVMTAGLACAAGYIYVALIFSVIVALGTVLISLIPMREERQMDLRITIPESLNFSGAFDDIFEKYAKSVKLSSVKTSNMGSLYKLQYKIELNDGSHSKEFIDELRCRNGNLEIILSEGEERSEEL